MNWKAHKLLKPPSDAEMAKMDPVELVKLHSTFHEGLDWLVSSACP